MRALCDKSPPALVASIQWHSQRQAWQGSGPTSYLLCPANWMSNPQINFSNFA